MEEFATGADGLIRSAEVARTGGSDRALRRAAQRGELVAVIPGVFARALDWNGADATARHRMRARAFAPRLGRRAVFSHETALALHGWDTLGGSADLLDVTDADVARGWLGASARVRALSLSGLDVETVGGLPVTAAGRTAVDAVVSHPFREAVVILDSALRVGIRRLDPRRPPESTTPLELPQFDAALSRRMPKRGLTHVSRVRSFADGRAASVGESLSRVVLHERGVPPAELQQPFFEGRAHIGDVDFWWEEFGVIGEFDGAVKYSRAEYLGGRTPAEAAIDEKVREDRLRSHPAVRGVARWMWKDIFAPGRLEARLRSAGVRW